MTTTATGWVTGIFAAVESVLIILAIKQVFVVSEHEWFFYTPAFAYVVAMTFILQRNRKKTRNRR
jgi:hypothetical protein